MIWETTHIVSAKIFLTIRHGQQSLTETMIMPNFDQLNKHQIKEQFITTINDLFEKMQKNIQFQDSQATHFHMGILIKSNESHQGRPICEKILGTIEVHKGKIGNLFLGGASKVILGETLQASFCTSMHMPFTPQMDALGNFI